MPDLQDQLETALEIEAEYELLGSLCVEPRKREDYRTRAKFQRSIVNELRAKLESLPRFKELPDGPTDGRER
jgi:hypothetical protein